MREARTRYQRQRDEAARFALTVLKMIGEGIRPVDVARKLKVSRQRVHQIIHGARLEQERAANRDAGTGQGADDASNQ